MKNILNHIVELINQENKLKNKKLFDLKCKNIILYKIKIYTKLKYIRLSCFLKNLKE